MDFLFIEYISMNIKDISMNIYDSGDTVENLLNVFMLRFVPTVKKVQIKCAFSIVNFQPPSADGLLEFTDTRIWSNNVYSFVFFNELSLFCNSDVEADNYLPES